MLRHGAYEMFNEEEAGDADKISNDFIAQDIDAILDRRSRTVVHDNTGTGSSAAGGTFSKASFKAKSPDPHSKGGDEEVDVDDPDFWKKFFKDLPQEDEEELHRGKRQRNKHNYSDRIYAENLEQNLLGDGDDDSSVESMDLEVHGIRLAWGGQKDSEWRKTDAETMLKSLCTYGYGNAITSERLSSVVLKDAHSANEVSYAIVDRFISQWGYLLRKNECYGPSFYYRSLSSSQTMQKTISAARQRAAKRKSLPRAF